MERMIRCILFVCLMVHGIGAETYYVTKHGNDQSGDGSPGSPWLTINKAAAVLQAGDTVLVREGTYRESVDPQNHGNESEGPIVYKAYPGENVIVNGADVVLGTWTQCTAQSHPEFPYPEKVWYIDVSSSWLHGLYEITSDLFMDQVLEDGTRMTYAHWPDQTDPDNTYDIDETYPVTHSTDGVSIIDDIHLTQADGSWNGCVLKGIFGENAGETHLYNVTAYDSATHTITVDRTLYRNPPRVGDDTYAIMNNPLALDSPGEFCIDYDNDRLYLMTYEQDDPNGHVIEVSTRKHGFDLSYMNASYITIEGFEIKGFYGSGVHHYNLVYGDVTGLVVRNCSIHQNVGNGIMIDVNVIMTATVIESNQVFNNDNKGFYFKCRSGSFEGMGILHNRLEKNNNNDAVQISSASGECNDFLLKGNYIGRHRSWKGHTDGIKMESGTFNNWIYEDNVLIDNIIDWGTTTYNNILFKNNVFAKGKHFHVRSLTVNGMIFINNTMCNPDTKIMFLGPAVTGMVVKNNVFDIRVPDRDIDWAGAQVENDHNFYMGILPGDAGTGSLAGDSTVLVDVASNDYRVMEGAAIIDAGTDVSAYGVDHDLVGNTRPNGSGWDMGAYEYYATGINPAVTDISRITPFHLPNPLYGNPHGLEAYSLDGKPVTEHTSGTVLVRVPGEDRYIKRILLK